MFSKNNMGDLMKKAQEMQENMKKMQDEVAKTKVVGEAGAGLVKVTMLGNHNVSAVEIDDSLLSDDKEILEDLIAAAINDSVRKVQEVNKSKMSGITGGMNLPEGFNMPF